MHNTQVNKTLMTKHDGTVSELAMEWRYVFMEYAGSWEL